MSPSTVRNELAELEALGLLTHPHTSAGARADGARLPLLRGPVARAARAAPGVLPLDLGDPSSELEAALQSTTDMLSQVTRLLALVSAPPIETATVRHVEVLLLQPQVLMAVAHHLGGVGHKAIVLVRWPVDPGLVEWASAT